MRKKPGVWLRVLSWDSDLGRLSVVIVEDDQCTGRDHPPRCADTTGVVVRESREI
jgi:hypothetical protein